MSDNSAGSPANTQPGPEVAVPDRAEKSQISIKGAASLEEVPGKTVSEVNEDLAPATQAQSDIVAPRVKSMAAPSVEAAQQVAVRPRIGDTRPAARPQAQPEPAPPPVSATPVGDVVGLRTPAKTRPPGQGQRRPSRSKQVAPEAAAEPKVPGSKASERAAELDGASPDDELENGSDESALSASATKGRRRSGRERRGKAVGRYLMCVHVRPHATQIAVLEGRTLVEHFVSRASDDTSQIDGNIYLGRVQNVLPGMEAAFVDIATPKNAVLYRGDVRYDLEDIETRSSSPLRIEQMLKPGQMIVCQVTKNPIGAKGARLTQEVSLPGRFVVMVPNSSAFGISKRLEDPERRRLRRIVDEIRPEGHGLIVRTAARGASLDELRHDVARLSAQWAVIESEASRTTTPKLLYREPDLGVRIVREELNNDYRAVIIDDPDLFQQVRDYVAGVNPELVDRIELYDTQVEPLPLFERYHVHEQLHKALDRKVWLPSGGSIIIERTEALTVIDVNTGKNVGTSNLEETVFRNNLEAAEEIARQLRLRDIGGIIVIDFIDMEIRENRDSVGSALRSALARDKTRAQVYEISELGLVEMTRKRVSEGLVESLSTTCTVCGGRGIMLDESLL
jgi:ribonuclease E